MKWLRVVLHGLIFLGLWAWVSGAEPSRGALWLACLLSGAVSGSVSAAAIGSLTLVIVHGWWSASEGPLLARAALAGVRSWQDAAVWTDLLGRAWPIGLAGAAAWVGRFSSDPALDDGPPSFGASSGERGVVGWAARLETSGRPSLALRLLRVAGERTAAAALAERIGMVRTAHRMWKEAGSPDDAARVSRRLGIAASDAVDPALELGAPVAAPRPAVETPALELESVRVARFVIDEDEGGGER